jgi:hypothetical protein
MSTDTKIHRAGDSNTSVVKASGGRVMGFSVTNRGSAEKYFLLYNQASGAPSGATNLVAAFFVPIGAALVVGSEFFTETGLKQFPVGIVAAVSSAKNTYTAGTATEHDYQVVYE